MDQKEIGFPTAFKWKQLTIHYLELLFCTLLFWYTRYTKCSGISRIAFLLRRLPKVGYWLEFSSSFWLRLQIVHFQNICFFFLCHVYMDLRINKQSSIRLPNRWDNLWFIERKVQQRSPITKFWKIHIGHTAFKICNINNIQSKVFLFEASSVENKKLGEIRTELLFLWGRLLTPNEEKCFEWPLT